MASERYHGSWDEMGARRWCAECEAWVNLVDWQEHRDHGDYRLDLEDYQATRVTVEIELTEPLFPDEEADSVTDFIEMNGGVESATLVGSNAKAGQYSTNDSRGENP